ncbi:conserved hypothetical protein [Rubrivivax sp. A210]|uniref:hypothetical protein n=1 Tax=Rubrivivax sp. A210 TaxID=2772301 RepID=UPI00191A7165|nr:hypothetical protein [Rubrivivax sp. A210]CAD5372274.1 conserved hypothetical protein [Rubrivivax sp. A210]
MAVPYHDVPVRSARDRVIDLLGMGDTYPLTDLNVVADQLKVAFGGTAKIPIENAQDGMSYQLCGPKGVPLGPAFRADGDGGTLVIETPVVNDDVTYRIQVEKKHSPLPLAPQGPRLLDEVAPVKVGIDTTLVIEIVAAPLLDAGKAKPQPADPRIVPYGSSVEVRVNKSQEGVDYGLILDNTEHPDITASGNLGAVLLNTGAVFEDLVIRVRATKVFLAADNRPVETTPLDARLFLKVMANPAPALAAEPASIVAHAQDAAIRIAQTQASASYRLYARAIADAEFLRDGAAGDPLRVTVAVPGRPDVQAPRPASASPWITPSGFEPLGPATPGTGGELRLAAPQRLKDAVYLVQATKLHEVDVDKPGTAQIASALALDAAAAVLVEPDAERVLALRVPVAGAESGGAMQVADGQPGVFYHCRPGAAASEFALPAYFHQRDTGDESQNKGLGQIAVEIDFAVATDADVAPATPAIPHPRPPVLEIKPFATDTALSIRAVKAQTGVETAMAREALVATVPDIKAEALLDHGAEASIVVLSSNADDRYRLMRGDTSIGLPQDGDSGDLAFGTEALVEDAALELVVTRAVHKGMAVERVVALPVRLRPDTRLAALMRRDSVPSGTATEVLLTASQPGVIYQLVVDDQALGKPLPGNGGELALPTGPITVDTVFAIRAVRADDDQVAVMLAARPAVALAT